MYEGNRNVGTFVKINCVVQTPFARLVIMSVDAFVDLDTMEILWTVVLDVDRCQCLVECHPNVQLTHTVTITFANLPVTTIWNVALMKSAIAVSV